MLKSFELEAVSKAQSLLNEEVKSEKTAFYCVGHTVIRYLIDDYPIKTLIGPKGKKATVELIAAFLPGIVVEILYAVTDRNNLDVISLTLEPIAAYERYLFRLR
jgi:cell division ATPase FtsA